MSAAEPNRHTDGCAAASLLNRFYRHLDERRYADLVQLMHPEGVWRRQGRDLRVDDILPALEQRSSAVRIHHLLTNLIVEMDRDGAAQVTAYMLVIRNDADVPADRPAGFDGIANVRTVRATCLATPAGWRISRLESAPPSFVRTAD